MDCQIARRAAQGFINQLARIAGSGKSVKSGAGDQVAHLAGGMAPAMMEGLEQRLVLAADLAFGAVSVGNLRALASTGGALSGSATIVNLGNAATGGFTYTASLSLDGVAGNEDDVVLTAQPVALESIAAGRNFRLNLNTLTIPSGLEPGAYRLVLRLDAGGTVTENSENNNSFVSPNQSIVLNSAATAPNLTIRVTSGAVTITPDGNVDLTTVISNRGPAINTPFTVTWTLSTDRIGGNAGDIELDSQVINGLGANASQTIGLVSLLPVGTEIGNYFLIATIDGPDLGVVDESNEGDNTFVSSSPLVRVILPDVTATFTTRSATVAPGQTITGNLTVRNQSATATGSGFRVGVYLVPATPTVGTEDLRIGSFDIPALAANGTFTLQNLQITLPLSAPAFDDGVLTRVAPGAYTIAVIADDADEIDEGGTGEENNVTEVSRVTISVPARGNDASGAVDLTVAIRGVSGSFVPGQQVNVEAVLNSLGNTFLQNGVAVRFFLSSDNTLGQSDLQMGTVNVLGPIAPGSLVINQALTVPTAAVSGRYFILAQVDPTNAVAETSETNNTSATAVASITVARPTVSVRPVAASVNEAAGNNARFTISRTGARTTAQTVNFTLSGTATGGSDFTSPQNLSVTIPAGAASIVLEIPVLGDAIGEGPETIILTLASGDGYSLGETGNTATVTIADSAPVITVRAVRPSVAEGASNAAAGFTFTRTGDRTAAQVVRFTLSGSAASGTDFALAQGVTPVAGQNGQFQVTIPAGAPSVTVNFPITNDSLAEDAETITATVIANSSNSYSIGAGNTGTATVIITDNEPVVTVTASDRTASEPVGTRVDTGSWTFTRTGDLSEALEVGFQLFGDAEEGADGGDYVLSNNAVPVAGSGTFVVTIPAGQSRAVVTLTARTDSEGEGPETAIVNLQSAPDYNVGAQETATVTINDAAPRITLAVTDARVAESATATPFNAGDFGRLTLTRTGDTTSALTIPVEIDSLASYGASGDYLVVVNGGTPAANLPSTVTFAVGSRTVTIDLIALNDASIEGPEEVRFSFGGDDGNYVFEEGASQVDLFIADNAPTVSVRAVDANAAETNAGQAANNGIIEFTRTGATTAALNVRFRADGIDEDLNIVAPAGITVTPVQGQAGLFQFTMPAGAASVRLTLTVINDSVGEDIEFFDFAVQSVAGSYAASVPPGGQAFIRVTDNDLPRVSLETDNSSVSESGLGDISNSTVVRVTREGGNQSRPLLVQLNVSGTAVNGTDFQNFPVAVTIPAGEAFVEIPLTAINDELPEGNETITLSIAVNEDSLYSAADEEVTVTIEDDEAPVISIVATDANAAEVFGAGAANGGLFTLSRVGGNINQALTVTVVVSGSATNGGDYDTISTSVTFLAGSATATLPVTIIDDVAVDAGETVVVTLASDENYTVSEAQGSATVTITDNEAPRVTITASDATAGENFTPTNNGVFTISRTGGNVTAALSVNLVITGTATNGTDYTTINTTVEIPANQTSVTIDVAALNDSLVENNETVILTLAANSNYTVDGTGTATVTIADDDVPTITVAATRSANENASIENRNGIFTITRAGGQLNQPVTVRYTISGTATSGTDFQTLSGEVVIPAGQTSATVNVSAIDDSIIEINESVALTLLASPTGLYNVGATSNAEIAIADDDGSVVTIQGVDVAGAEVAGLGAANGASVRLVRTGGNIAEALTVTIAITGTATNGVDYTTIPTTVTFAPGSATATINISVTDDSIAETFETVAFEVVQGSGYQLGNQVTSSVTIFDNEVPEVSIEATDPNAAEVTTGTANGGQFTLRRLGDLSQALTVNIAVSGTATAGSDFTTLPLTVTFAANSATATLSLVVIDDSAAESPETVSVTVAPSGGESGTYTVGSVNVSEVTIADNEPPQVTVATTDPNAAEVASGGQANDGLFTFTRVGGNQAAELTITIAITGTATNGVDFVTIPTTVTFAAGSSTATVPVTVIDDNGLDANETVIVTIQPSGSNAYTVGVGNTGTVTIADDEQAVEFGVSNVTASQQTYFVNSVENASFIFSYSVFGGNQNPRNARIEVWASLDGTLNPSTDTLLNFTTGTIFPGVSNSSPTIQLPDLAAGSYTLIMRILPSVPGDVDTQPSNDIAVSDAGVLQVFDN
jgi:hypothetical protein